MKYVTNYVYVLMIEVCINISKIHMAGYLGGIYVQVHTGVSSYVQLYGTVDRTEKHEARFSDDVFSVMEIRR